MHIPLILTNKGYVQGHCTLKCVKIFIMKEYEKILKALANRRRLEILRYLKESKEANVGDIAKHIKLSFKSTSRHLAVLFGSDIVEKEQRNVLVFYSLAPKFPPIARNIVSFL